MEEVVDGQEQRAASVLEMAGDPNDILEAELLQAGVPEADLAAILGDNGAIDPLPQMDGTDAVEDQPFDIVDAIMDAPDDFVADPQINEAFVSILQSNDADVADIEAVLALANNDAPAADLAATTGIGENGEPVAPAAADGDGTEIVDAAEEVSDGDPSELLADGLTQAGVEAQSGAVEGDDALTSMPANECPGMMEAAVTTQTDGMDVAPAGEGEEPAAGMMNTNEGSDGSACDPNSMDWMAVGPAGLSKLGEVVAAFQELVEETNDMFAALPVNGCCMPCPNTSMDMILSDMDTVLDMESQMPNMDMDLDA